MNQTATDFGILTLATPSDYLKAIGLALSVRASNPGVPIAVACSSRVRPLVEPYFDHVISEETGIRGFAHKVYIDRYSPFTETMFFDSDVLVFKPVIPYVAHWREHAYAACGKYQSSGKSTFGMDRAAMLAKIGKTELTVIDGAGHAYFRKPACFEIFEEAREITKNHKEFMGGIPYADEDVMDVVMTKFDIPPMPYGDFFSRRSSAKPGTLKMDATRGLCEFVYLDTGEVMNPCMMHFAANEAPFVYHYQLHKLFTKNHAPAPGLWRSALDDFYQRSIRLRLHSLKKWITGSR